LIGRAVLAKTQVIQYFEAAYYQPKLDRQ